MVGVLSAHTRNQRMAAARISTGMKGEELDDKIMARKTHLKTAAHAKR